MSRVPLNTMKHMVEQSLFTYLYTSRLVLEAEVEMESCVVKASSTSSSSASSLVITTSVPPRVSTACEHREHGELASWTCVLVTLAADLELSPQLLHPRLRWLPGGFPVLSSRRCNILHLLEGRRLG